MIKQITLFTLLFFSFSSTSHAQFDGFSHEIGVIAGPISFKSDYADRNDLSINSGNNGFGIGVIHYLDFSYDTGCNCYTPKTYFNDHFKFRTELSYNKTNFKHFGKWVDQNKPSDGANQLRAMRGSSAVTNLGMQLEYFPWSIRDFSVATGNLGPFLSLGGQFSYYNAKASSSLGPLGTPLTTFPKYLIPNEGRLNGFSSESRPVWSIVSSVGSRFKVSPLSDLMIDLRMQYYFSDWVDGLNPNPEVYQENKKNDWVIWFNVGYIHYL